MPNQEVPSGAWRMVFKPLRMFPESKKLFGVVMLRDLKPDVEAELVQVCIRA